MTVFLCYVPKISLNCTKNFQTVKMYLKNSKVNNNSMEMNLQQAFEI